MNFLRYELKRIGWPILVGILSLLVAFHVGISQANLETILFKFLVFCPALVLVHSSRRTLFPYIDISMAVDQRRDLIVLAMILYYIGMAYVLTAVI